MSLFKPENSMKFTKYLGGTGASLTTVHTRKPINPALSRSGKMDGSAMSG